MSVWLLLRRSRKFWIAIVAIIQTVVFSAFPDFPEEIWMAIDQLAGVLIVAIAVEDVAAKIADGIRYSNTE